LNASGKFGSIWMACLYSLQQGHTQARVSDVETRSAPSQKVALDRCFHVALVVVAACEIAVRDGEVWSQSNGLLVRGFGIGKATNLLRK
jgi:hypothetical protein